MVYGSASEPNYSDHTVWCDHTIFSSNRKCLSYGAHRWPGWRDLVYRSRRNWANYDCRRHNRVSNTDSCWTARSDHRGTRRQSVVHRGTWESDWKDYPRG